MQILLTLVILAQLYLFAIVGCLGTIGTMLDVRKKTVPVLALTKGILVIELWCGILLLAVWWRWGIGMHFGVGIVNLASWFGFWAILVHKRSK